MAHHVHHPRRYPKTAALTRLSPERAQVAVRHGPAAIAQNSPKSGEKMP
jgi:hypothetical protein